jgi:hypothetical protein
VWWRASSGNDELLQHIRFSFINSLTDNRQKSSTESKKWKKFNPWQSEAPSSRDFSLRNQVSAPVSPYHP